MVAKVECKFCNSNPGKFILKGDLGFAAWDSFPVNQGHVLVIPYRHVSEYFDATDSEKQELWSLVDKAKAIIDEKYAPDGYNVGINIGHWAGQSIPHLHIHLMPRYQGDVENPKGGVRGVVPQRQKYDTSKPTFKG
jgi:diadenosine tetraphosphate (Ap4A) HIT family hydrolase